LFSSLITRKRKEKEVCQAQGSLLPEIQIEGMEETRIRCTLNATIVTRKVTMLEIALRRTMLQETTQETTIVGSN